MCYIYLFNDTATTKIYTLSLHDALPISRQALIASAGHRQERVSVHARENGGDGEAGRIEGEDRKSTRLNSSHSSISYAVFCLKKKRSIIINYNIFNFKLIFHYDQNYIAM